MYIRACEERVKKRANTRMGDARWERVSGRIKTTTVLDSAAPVTSVFASVSWRNGRCVFNTESRMLVDNGTITPLNDSPCRFLEVPVSPYTVTYGAHVRGLVSRNQARIPRGGAVHSQHARYMQLDLCSDLWSRMLRLTRW